MKTASLMKMAAVAASTAALVMTAAIAGSGCKPGRGGEDEPAHADEASESREEGTEAEETTGEPEAETTEEATAEPVIELGLEDIDPELTSRASRANVKGLNLLKKKKLDKAREAFEEALSIDPHLATAHYNLACTLSRQGETAAAAASLEQVFVLGFPRFGYKIDEDPDLEQLRESDEWEEVQALREEYAKHWSEALASPGAFLLVAEKQVLKDSYGYIIDEEDESRGRMWFWHAATGRFLPMDAGRRVAGFLVGESALHAVTFNNMVVEMDTIPSQYLGVKLVRFDLGDLTSTKTNISSGATGVVLYEHEGEVYVRWAEFVEPTAREFWYDGVIVDGKLVEKGKRETEPTPIDLSDGEWKGGPAYCEARVDEPVPTDLFLTLDVFCGPGFPESPVKGDREAEAGCVDPDETTRLCTGERSTDPDTLTIKGEGDETEVVTSGLEIIQMFAR